MSIPPRRSGFWLACLVVGAGIGAVASRWTQADLPMPKTIIKSPQDLSAAFRAVSVSAIPAIVSIETKTRARVVEQDLGAQDGADPFQNSPFGDDPIFREFFGQGRGQGGRRRFQIPGQQGAGSGFVIDASGVVVPNAHVVAGADEVVVRLTDGTEIKADKWMGDSVTDVAIILLKSEKPLTAVSFGDSDAMQIGDWVLALGNPFDLGTTVTAGIISATDRKGLDINAREHFLQTDAAINPGNSGGALVNMNGEVIGINTAISTRSGGYDGVGFAIPSNQARKIVEKLRKDGTVHRAYLGVALDDLKPRVKQALGIKSGVAVLEVMPNTPASKAGVEPGDILVQFAGKPVKDRPALQEFVEQLEPGKSYPAEILRDGKTVKLDITLEQRNSDAYAKTDPKTTSPDAQQEVSKLGFSAKTLTPEIAEELGIAGAKGVVIVQVTPGSVTAQAGIQSGDVIIKVGQTKVETLEAFQKAIGEAKLADGILLQVRRGNTTRLILLQSD
jgi:serine protease Do